MYNFNNDCVYTFYYVQEEEAFLRLPKRDGFLIQVTTSSIGTSTHAGSNKLVEYLQLGYAWL